MLDGAADILDKNHKSRKQSEAQIDEMYLQSPYSGSRSIRRQFKRRCKRVNRKRIQRMMCLMGIKAVYPKPRTSYPHPEHRIYPNLLRDLTIERPNQV
jgi:putative transposase